MKFIEMILIVFYSALFGGLLTVISYRLPRMLLESTQNFNLFFPASHCPACKAKIHWQYKLPIAGYLISRGRCHSCKAKIPLQYVLTEILFTLLIVVLFIYYGLSWHFAFLAIFAFFATALFLIDMRYGLLPDALVFPLGAFGLLASVYNIFVSSRQAIIGCLIGFAIAYAVAGIYQYLRGREGLAFGDVKLLAALGAWLGPWALPFILLQASILLLAYAGLRTLLTSRKTAKSFLRLKIAFGPFLLLGAATLLLLNPLSPLLLLQGG